MHADIRVSNRSFDPPLWNQRRRYPDRCVCSVHERWSGTHEREGHRVPPWIAALQVTAAIFRMCRLRVVLVGGKPVMVFRVIVIVVGVGVQQRRHARGRNQRRDEQRCQGAMHTMSV